MLLEFLGDVKIKVKPDVKPGPDLAAKQELSVKPVSLHSYLIVSPKADMCPVALVHPGKNPTGLNNRFGAVPWAQLCMVSYQLAASFREYPVRAFQITGYALKLFMSPSTLALIISVSRTTLDSRLLDPRLTTHGYDHISQLGSREVELQGASNAGSQQAKAGRLLS